MTLELIWNVFFKIGDTMNRILSITILILAQSILFAQTENISHKLLDAVAKYKYF